jgi:hypothetical protein
VYIIAFVYIVLTRQTPLEMLQPHADRIARSQPIAERDTDFANRI